MKSVIVIAVIAGALAGAVSALAGVGGGVLLVPTFRAFFGLDQKHAIATSSAIIFVTTLASSVQFARGGLIDWKLFAFTAIGSVLVAFFVADQLKKFQNLTLERGFAVLLITGGIVMLLGKSETVENEDVAPPPQAGGKIDE